MDNNEGENAKKIDEGFEFPVWNPIRRKFYPDEPFFHHGNAQREILAKQATVEQDEEDAILMHLENSWNFPCPIMGCKAQLSALMDFEEHYKARHTATCSICSKTFPTTRLLNIHIAESHDSFFQAKVARGYPMYECLVEGCSSKFNTYKGRHLHLIDKHKFPISFEFSKKRHLSKRQRRGQQGKVDQPQSLNQKKKNMERHSRVNKNEDGSTMEYKQNKENDGNEQMIDALTEGVSKLSTKDHIPSVVSFGRRHNKAFEFVPRSRRNM